MDDLRRQVGQMDIYLVDQLLKGRIASGSRIADVGCGFGRNLSFFLRNGFPVAAVDPDATAIESVRDLAQALGSSHANPVALEDPFRVEAMEAMTLPDGWAEVVINNAVLHFAHDPDHFARMLQGSWRLLRPGGLYFCRLCSTIGMEASRFLPLGPGRFRLPDGSERYLVSADDLAGWTERLGGRLLDPIKTTVVQDARCMTTWVMEKGSPTPGT